MGLKRETEASFMAAVVQYATLCGWECYHTRDSRGSAAGFPDLAFRRRSKRGGRWAVVVAELKAEGGAVAPAQRLWVEAFADAMGSDRAFVWRPSDWPEIQRVLGARP